MLIEQPCGTTVLPVGTDIACPIPKYPTKVGPQLAPLSSKGCQITMLKATLKGSAEHT